MASFKQRSNQKELLDEDNIPFTAIQQNMRELNVINHLLGGHKITLKGVKKVSGSNLLKTVYSIVEIGCGGGDNLRAIKQWADKKGYVVQLTGVDINKECIAYAQSQQSNSGIRFICSDYKAVHFEQKPHIIFSSLFCHHFTDEELVYMLQWMKAQATTGFFINDLHRHPLAYHSIKLLTSVFSKSYLVKNDAPLSVLRGFTKRDWQMLFKNAGIKEYQISWQWAFRWLLSFVH